MQLLLGSCTNFSAAQLQGEHHGIVIIGFLGGILVIPREGDCEDGA